MVAETKPVVNVDKSKDVTATCEIVPPSVFRDFIIELSWIMMPGRLSANICESEASRKEVGVCDVGNGEGNGKGRSSSDVTYGSIDNAC